MTAVVGTTWVALKRLRVEGDWRNPGDLVPEASNWKHRRVYVENGSIAAIPVLGDTVTDDDGNVTVTLTADADTLADVAEQIAAGDPPLPVVELEEMPFDELREYARDRGVTGRSRQDLIDGILGGE